MKEVNNCMTEAELIDEYTKKNSQQAAYAIVEKYRTFVFSVALRYTNNYDDAADISQEAFIKAFENLHNFQKKSSLKTWLYRITVNTFLSINKKRNIHNVFQKQDITVLDNTEASQSNPEQELEFNELNQKFLEAINNLPEKQREVFCLRYFDELKYEEISELLGLTVGGLKANYFHAIKKITKSLRTQNLY